MNATTRSHTTNLAAFEAHQALLLVDEKESKEHHEHAVAAVAEHDGEEEGEGDDGERSRVHLLVRGHAVGIHDGLECPRVLVGEVVRRGLLVRGHGAEDGFRTRAAAMCAIAESITNVREACLGTPALAEKRAPIKGQ